MFNLNSFLRPINLRRDVRKHVTAMFSHFIPNAQVYDIGCGRKPFARSLEAAGFRCIGVDLENGFYDSESIDLIGSAYSVPVGDGVADAVLSIQVIEHLERPRDAFLEAARILKPGGIMIVSFPFLYPIHAAPFDYMRYTKSFLINLARESGFEVLERNEISGFWYVAGMNLGLYLQTFDRGILKWTGATKVVIVLLQCACILIHFLEGRILRLLGKNVDSFRSVWTTNYIFSLKKSISNE